MPNKHTLSKAFLQKMYTERGLSTWAIEKKYGFSRSSVYTALRKFDIPTRSIAESHIKYNRSDFSGNLREKAYLLGFAIGDLRVRNHNKKRSETISIACGSTKKAQIDLIKDLFSPYGRVWAGRMNDRGVVNTEAFVNKSFNFLLPETRTYEWCAKHKEHFYSFLAGFTDAEGSFFISEGKAFIAWGNYDRQLLQFIRNNLKLYGVEVPKLFSDKLKGKRGVHGFVRNQTYHHLSICKKTEVKKLINCLRPHIRHRDKIKKLAVIEENIKLRNK